MANRFSLVSPLAAASAVFFLDPVSGRRRRARFLDAAHHVMKNAEHFLDVAVRDAKNRVWGSFYGVRYRRKGEGIADDKLASRVASKIGRCVSHPGAIETIAESGVVTLRGKILRHEVPRMMAQVAKVPGVKRVHDELDVYKKAGDVPALQGGFARGQRMGRGTTTPASKLLSFGGGGFLILDALRRGGVLGLAELLGGAAACAQSMGMAARPEIAVQKGLTIHAPLDRVFAFFADQTKFPLFMRNVKDVRVTGDGHTRWTVRGPVGAPVSWEARTTRLEPNHLIAWKSEPGSFVRNGGVLSFRPMDDGSTKVDIRLTYRPPAGVIGHWVASIFGADPKHEMDEDLILVKSFLETGRRPRHTAQPTIFWG